MTFLLFLLAFFTAAPLAAQDTIRKPLYQLPSLTPAARISDTETRNMLVASDEGLFRIVGENTAVPLWTGGKVTQILHTNIIKDGGDRVEQWYFITSRGILVSNDLVDFELRNKGLPELVTFDYDGKTITTVTQVQDLKDICANPQNPLELVTATKDSVYITYNGGQVWKSLGSMSKYTSGIKAVAIADMSRYAADGTREAGTDLVVFMSHPIFGFSYILPDAPRPQWKDVSSGFKIMPSLTTPDEISDIIPVLRTSADNSRYVELYVSQSFLPNLYRFNWKNKKGECVYTGSEPTDTIDGLARVENALLFISPGTFGSYDFKENVSPGIPANLPLWKQKFAAVQGVVNAAWIPQSLSGFENGFVLNELWLLHPEKIVSKYSKKVLGRKSLYIPAYQVRKQTGLEGIDRFRKIIRDNKLNSLVIDMKDDYGLLRYDTRNPLVQEKATTSQYAVDLDRFVSEFKKDHVYLIARIVVFKDRNLSRWNNGKDAVWDYSKNAPWIGIKGYEDEKDSNGTVIGKKAIYYDENWVDPYSPEVWEYNTAIAKELVARGFDEVQFDYIRFPTDGYNLNNAAYRWRGKGMDKESALVSFLAYARKNIDAPIGIDIYGANGWYRSGSRTGQDVEMLAKYVDVISPMFYPSHFEQSFLNYAPYAERPYRIYFYGTYRTSIIGRDRVIVRPWVQAFNLNVSYDRKYYGSEYVRKEIFGTRDGADHGYMYWNNVGDYSTISPDIGTQPYPGTAPESDPKFRKPAFGSGPQQQPVPVSSKLSVLDSIVNQREYTDGSSAFNPILNIRMSEKQGKN